MSNNAIRGLILFSGVFLALASGAEWGTEQCGTIASITLVLMFVMPLAKAELEKESNSRVQSLESLKSPDNKHGLTDWFMTEMVLEAWSQGRSRAVISLGLGISMEKVDRILDVEKEV
ncbi:hypothetical protein [Kosakonia radicincitans]|uniref:hypothetical protein n=1 Tax=Kosakonia radicincitans TaxID=283686 RepID=UPI001D076B86|nr:hypothetical protein [Kosakonia radicincitans]